MRAFRPTREQLPSWLVIALAALFLSVFQPFHAIAAPAKLKQAQGKPRQVAQHSRHAVKKAKPGVTKKTAVKQKTRGVAKPLKRKKQRVQHGKQPAQKAVSRVPRPASAPGIPPATAPIASPNAAAVASPPMPEARMACSINGKVYLMRDCGDATPPIADSPAQ